MAVLDGRPSAAALDDIFAETPVTRKGDGRKVQESASRYANESIIESNEKEERGWLRSDRLCKQGSSAPLTRELLSSAQFREANCMAGVTINLPRLHGTEKLIIAMCEWC